MWCSRAGIPSTTSNAIQLATRIFHSPHIHFSGIYSHSGHSYDSPDITSALQIAKEEVRQTLALAQDLRSLGISAPVASVGATPSVKALLEIAGAGREAVMEARLALGAAEDLMHETSDLATDVAASALPEDEQDEKAHRADTPNSGDKMHVVPTGTIPHDYKLEVHLGNYIFLDVQQISGFPWPLSRCAATVLTRVLSHYSHRNEVLVDAGALALSKDGPGVRGATIYPGFGVILGEVFGHRTITRISQEHGIIGGVTLEEMDAFFEIGTTLQVVPNHVCLAAANFDWYYVVEDGKVVDVWVPCRGW